MPAWFHALLAVSLAVIVVLMFNIGNYIFATVGAFLALFNVLAAVARWKVGQ